jgi:hypothetical protein
MQLERKNPAGQVTGLENGKRTTPAPCPEKAGLSSEMRKKNLQEVLDCARRGWPTIPVGIKWNGAKFDKRPLIADWQNSRIVDPDKLRAMGARDNFDRGYGILTGEPSGLFVLDFDGEAGQRTLDDLKAKGLLPETLTVRTISGGNHLHFKYEGRLATLKNTARALPGVDIRTTGGFVARGHLPGGKGYDVLNPAAPVAEMPPALLELLTQPKTPHKAAALPTEERDTSDPAQTSAWADAALRGEMEAVRTAAEGERNDTLNRAAFALGQLVGGGSLDRAEVEQALLDAALACGLPAFEAQKTIRSGIDNGIKKPRTAPVSATSAAPDTDDEDSIAFLGPVPPAPRGCFHPLLEAAVANMGEALSRVEPEICYATLLAWASALVLGNRLISPKAGWNEPCVLWIAVVADSGNGKTPASNLVFRAMKTADAEQADLFNNALIQWKTAYAVWQKAMKDAPDQAGEEPLKPKQVEYFIEDMTAEGMGKTLLANPKGAAILRDEISGVFAEAARYSGGSKDSLRGRLLSCWDGTGWKITRANEEKNITIRQAYVSLFGTIQPHVFKTVFDVGSAGTGLDAATGWLQRHCNIRSARRAANTWSDAVISDETRAIFRQVTENILAWPVEKARAKNAVGIMPSVVHLEDGAKSLYMGWFDKMANAGAVSNNEAIYTKLQANALRIALALHCLEAAIGATEPLRGCSPQGAGNLDGIMSCTGADYAEQGATLSLRPVSADCMRRALLLADWVRENQEQIFAFCKSGDKVTALNAVEQAVADVLIANADAIQVNGMAILNDNLYPPVLGKFPALTRDRLGRVPKRLGLTPDKIQGKRGWRIDEKTFSLLKKSVQCVHSVQSSANSGSPAGHFENGSVHSVQSPTDEKNGVDTLDTWTLEVSTRKPLDIKNQDTLDTLDTFSEEYFENGGGYGKPH